MRIAISIAAGILALPCNAQAPSVRLGGTEVALGMLKTEIEADIAAPYRLSCAPPTEGDVRFGGEAEDCLVMNGEIQDGELSFESGRVEYAARHWGHFDDARAHELAALLYEMLAGLTDGNDTCAMIRTGTPPRQTVLVLPNKVLLVMSFDGDEQDYVVVEEVLRSNPGSISYGTQRPGATGSGHCVFEATD